MLKGFEALDLSPNFHGYAYQLNAVESVKSLEYAALFHEQGLGKTKIGLDLALNWISTKTLDTVIIITKKGLVKNWEKETNSHTNLSYAVLDGNRVQNSYKFNKPYRLYITHYEAISSNLEKFSLLLKTRRVGAILDEAHHMKNPEGRVAQALYTLAPGLKRRVIMTGTPVANRPYDIWSPIFFLDQGKSLGDDFAAFKTMYDLPQGSPDNPDPEYENTLGDITLALEPFTIRETKKSAGIDLPQKVLSNHYVDMEGNQAALYQKYKNDLYVQIIKNGRIKHDDVHSILKEMLRLVQVASNPAMVDESYNHRPGKMVALDQIISDIDRDEKIIVWTCFIDNADYLTDQLASMGSLKLHGKMDMEARNRSIEKFLQESDKRILVATPGAAKEGLTLTVANHAVFFDRNFSLNDWLQAQDRIHRISQSKQCHIFHLLAKDSIDEWVDRLLLYKRRLAALVQGDTDNDNAQGHSSDEAKNIIKEVLQP